MPMHKLKFPEDLDIEHLAEIVNPTGGRQAATPWQAHDRTRGICRYAIRDANGVTLARFVGREDRDFALFWVNCHAGIIGLFWQMAEGFRFIEHGTLDTTAAPIARNGAEHAEIWHEFFKTLGESARRAAAEQETSS